MAITLDRDQGLLVEDDEQIGLECPYCGVYAHMRPQSVPHASDLLQVRPKHVGLVFQCDACKAPVFLRFAVRHYAENQVAVETNVRPTFVTVLKARLPDTDALRAEAKQIAVTVGTALDRPHANVHVLYAPPAEGRLAFGGELLEAR